MSTARTAAVLTPGTRGAACPRGQQGAPPCPLTPDRAAPVPPGVRTVVLYMCLRRARTTRDPLSVSVTRGPVCPLPGSCGSWRVDEGGMDTLRDAGEMRKYRLGWPEPLSIWLKYHTARTVRGAVVRAAVARAAERAAEGKGV
eukprot:scaffold76800_cov45-Phaeocystis_antarctica.AAC.1